ncbi:MAG: hypothetical protein MJK15_06025 [Colwellia sp.]|nr:hypothetical protein [Colwellia sp.]
MLAVKSSLFHKFIVLSITTVIVLWLINIWNINLWQQVLLEKKANNIMVHPPSKTLEKNAQKKPLVFTTINLPELPKPAIELVKNIASNSNSSAIKSKQLPPKEQQNRANIQPSKRSDKQPINAVTKLVVKITAKESTSAIYQQLIADSAINIELAWPNKISARQSLFTFLYQCIGMKFGVLNNQKVTLVKTFYQHSSDEQQPSEWLRIAQGQLASQERLWLQQSHLSGTPVRLFPKAVDWQLAKLINKQLNGKPLKNLRAHYNYANHALMLNNIRLNGQLLTKNWLLIENKCSTLNQ